MQQCIYRISAPVTAFKVRDPDPNAVDEGHVLGLRFEIMSRGQFLRPYYVMLNRPYPGSRHLRVHRHTVPPAVPLAGLAARYLPAPSSSRTGSAEGSTEQDLDRFVRTLRREVVRYHNRLGVSADLRRRLGLHERGSERGGSPNALVEASIADIEAKQINLTWADDRTGRLVMDDDGNVVKFVVFGRDGRDWEASSAVFEKNDSIEDVARKLEERLEESLLE
jgi:central kinetochore subunit Mal2/MCM21